MEWKEALRIVVEKTGHRDYERLCADGNPNKDERDRYREHVVVLAQSSHFNLVEKATRFAGAVFQHVVAGLPRLSKDETEIRLNVCRACPQFYDRTCILCGCNMRIKASWAEQKCPLGKWPELGRKSDELALGSTRSDFESEATYATDHSSATE